MRHHGRFLNQDVERSGGDQFATASANLPPTTPANAPPAQDAAQSNPQRPRTAHQPRGFLLRRLSDAGPRHGCTNRRPAGIRNPPRSPANASPAQAAAQSNPHKPRTAHQPPRVPSSEAFGRRPSPRLYKSTTGPASETLHDGSSSSREGPVLRSGGAIPGVRLISRFGAT